jgi:phasin family protein
LPGISAFADKLTDLCIAQLFLTLLCGALYLEKSGSRGPPADLSNISLGKDSMMVKIEEIQQYGTSLQSGVQAIASAYGDYTKKSFEDTKSYVEKLTGVKSLDKALEVQTEYAKSAYETFVAESQKIAGLYTDLAKQTFKPLEGMAAKFTPASVA